MRFWSLLVVAWMPVLQILLAGLLGACLESSRFNVLTSDARRSINKVVYIVFVPSLVFSSLAGTVTLKDIISWWFMPVNMGIILLIGATLGWLAVKALRPGEHLQGLVIACSSAGNWGTIPLMIVPAICNEEDSPFGDASTCRTLGLSYVSLSMALGNFYIWTHSYSIMKRSAQLYKKGCTDHPTTNIRKEESSGDDQNGTHAAFLPLSSGEFCEDVPSNSVSAALPSNGVASSLMHCSRRAKDLLVEILKELWSPPSVAALIGFTVGAIAKLKSLVTEEDVRPSPSSPRYRKVTRRCCNTVHRPHTRRKPHKRQSWDKDEASGSRINHRHTLRHPPRLRNRRGEGSQRAWVPTKISPVPLRSAVAVYSSPRHEHWDNSSAV